MTKKQKNVYGAIVIIVLIILAVKYVKMSPSKNDGGSNNNNSQNNSANPSPSPSGSSNDSNSGTQNGQTWTGTLKASDSSKKGNLMLVTPDHTIYIQTSRDYSALIGKEVVVEYEGTTDSFVLKNISAK